MSAPSAASASSAARRSRRSSSLADASRIRVDAAIAAGAAVYVQPTVTFVYPPGGPVFLADDRPPEAVRPAAVAATPGRPPPASERLGRGHGESRGRGWVSGGRDHQRRRGRNARLRGPRGCAGRRDACRGRADRQGRRGARDGRRRGRLRDGTPPSWSLRCGAPGPPAATSRTPTTPPAASAIPTGTRSGSGRFARPRRRTATGSSSTPGSTSSSSRFPRRRRPRDPGGARSRSAGARECLPRGRRRLRVPDRRSWIAPRRSPVRAG